jgi:glycerol-3-phosphate acyltransferase PlsY
MIYIPAVSSIIGHSFPIQFFIYACIHGSFNSANHYCGGKSVGTYGGVYMAISWKAALILLTIWFIIMKISRYVSLASICVTVIAAAVLFIPYIGFDFYFAHNWKATLNDQLIVFALYWFGGLMITWRHRTNIVRLLKGTENKTTDRTKQSVPPIPPVSPVN